MASRHSRFELLKRDEQALCVFGRHAGAVVLDFYAKEAVVLGSCRHLYRATNRRELQRVGEVVVEELLESAGIQGDVGECRVHRYRYADALRGSFVHALNDALHQKLEIDRLRPKFHLTGLYLGQVQHVIDQP